MFFILVLFRVSGLLGFDRVSARIPRRLSRASGGRSTNDGHGLCAARNHKQLIATEEGKGRSRKLHRRRRAASRTDLREIQTELEAEAYGTLEIQRDSTSVSERGGIGLR
jgi:hypothetical protein